MVQFQIDSVNPLPDEKKSRVLTTGGAKLFRVGYLFAAVCTDWIITLPVARIDVAVEVATGGFTGASAGKKGCEQSGDAADQSPNKLSQTGRWRICLHRGRGLQGFNLMMSNPGRTTGSVAAGRQSAFSVHHIKKFIPVYGFVRGILIRTGLRIHHPLLIVSLRQPSEPWPRSAGT